jgi:hypothetical protein
MKAKAILYRQGDVLMKRITKLPQGERKKRENATLAYGEVTGHSHRVAVEDRALAEVLEIDKRGLYVHVSENGIHIEGIHIVHEEHGTIALPPGDYKITIQREWNPEAIRNVLD